MADSPNYDVYGAKVTVERAKGIVMLQITRPGGASYLRLTLSAGEALQLSALLSDASLSASEPEAGNGG